MMGITCVENKMKLTKRLPQRLARVRAVAVWKIERNENDRRTSSHQYTRIDPDGKQG